MLFGITHLKKIKLAKINSRKIHSLDQPGFKNNKVCKALKFIQSRYFERTAIPTLCWVALNVNTSILKLISSQRDKPIKQNSIMILNEYE